MRIFEITIQHKRGGAWPVVVEYNQPGPFLPRRVEGSLQLEVKLLIGQPNPLDYGTILGEALFKGEIRDVFSQARAEQSEETLRVLLFVEDDELKTLHWERLAAPQAGEVWDHLALDQAALFSLYLPSLTDRSFPPIGRNDLRALIMVAHPPGLADWGLDSFNPNQTVVSLQRALGDKIEAHVLADEALPGRVGPPTLDALVDRLTTERYTLLHIVAHGRYDKESGDTALYLTATKTNEPDDWVDPVTGTQLIRRLRRLRGGRGLPYQVFLSSCESARPEAEAGLGGLGQRLVREVGIPAVIAMTEPISIDTAEKLARTFYAQLGQHGEPDRALIEASAGLTGHHDVIVPALYSRLGGRKLFSDSLDRTLNNDDIQRGLDRLADLVTERAPVLAETIEAQAKILRGVLGAAVDALSEIAKKDRKTALDEINDLCQKITDLSFNALALGQEPPPYDGRCPFPGLRPFGLKDEQENDYRDFFFGREAWVAMLVDRLEESPFLAVLGDSGSGKSSLVMAGLVPAWVKKHPDFQIQYMTPGSDPVTTLKNTLHPPARSMADSPTTPDRARPPSLLIVDQFEELFTLCTDRGRRQAFLDRLRHLPQPQVKIVITLRADFLGECAPYDDLRQNLQSYLLVPPLDTAERRSAMEQQARAVGLQFEANLSHTILADVEDEPGAMPLLQHLLREMWARRHGRWLLTVEYKALGGIRQAIAQTAEKLYGDKNLSTVERNYIRDIFIRLTRLDETVDAEQKHRDTRRRESRANLILNPEDAPLVRDLVRRLADARLVVTSLKNAASYSGPPDKMVDVDDSLVEVEVAHEALIRNWPRLQAWLDEDRELFRLRAGISQAAQEAESDLTDTGLLIHRGSRLEEIEKLLRRRRLTLNPQEQRYIEACIDLRDAEIAREEELRRKELDAARKLAEEAEARRKAESERAEEEAQHAQELRELLIEAKRQTRIARSSRLAVRSYLALTELGDVATSSSLQLLLAREAMLTTWLSDADEISIPFATAEAETVLRLAINAAHPWEMTLPPHRHPATIFSVAYSPDGQALVTASEDQTARVWEAMTGKQLHLLAGHMASVLSVAYSPDGQALVTTSEDQTARVWEAMTGKELGQLIGHSRTVWSAAFSPDGRQIVTASADHTARVWDSETRETVLVLRGHTGSVRSATFSPDGRQVVTASEDRTVRIWELPAGREVDRLQDDMEDLGDYKWRWAIFDPRGKQILTLSQNLTVQMWAVNPFKKLYDLAGHVDWVWSVAFSPDGQQIVTASEDQTARVWDAKTGVQLSVVDHFSSVRAAAFSPDGQRIVTASQDKIVRVWDIATGQAARSIGGHAAGVLATAFSPNGQQIVTASADRTARVWDVASGEELYVLTGHRSKIKSVAFSPDGRLIATASQDHTACLWRATTGELLHRLVGHSDSVEMIVFSKLHKKSIVTAGTHQIIVTASQDRTARIWDVSTGRELHILAAHEHSVFSVALSPDDQLIVTAGEDEMAYVWDVTAGLVLFGLAGHTKTVRSVTFSPDGSRIVTASVDQTARLWDVATGQEIGQLRGHQHAVRSATFSPHGDQIVTASNDRTARVWDATTGLELAELVGHQDTVRSATFSPDGTQIVTISNDWTARVWDVTTGNEIHLLAGHTAGLRAVAFSPDGQKIVTASEDQTARIWKATWRGELRTLRGHTDSVLSVAFSPDGEMVVTTGEDETVRVWDFATGKELNLLSGHEGEALSSVFDPDGRRVLTAGADGVVRLWDLATGQRILSLDGHTEPVWSVAYSPDGRQIVTASEDQTARVWDAATGQEILSLVGHSDLVWSAAFSPDGRQIITTSDDQTARIWDAANGQELRLLSGHTAGVLSAAFSPDGEKIVTSSDDQTGLIWDTATGEELQLLAGHLAVIWSAAFSPDGRQIVTASDDHTARVWDVKTGQTLYTLEGHTDRVLSAIYSPIGGRIVTASGDQTVRIWPNTADLLAMATSLIQREPPVLTGLERQQHGLEG